jgi:hypothetical protein
MFIGQRRTIQFLAVMLPLRQVEFHQGMEPQIMGWFQKTAQFVHHDIFEAFGGLFRQFGIQADAFRRGITASPFGPHALYEKASGSNTQFLGPFRE